MSSLRNVGALLVVPALISPASQALAKDYLSVAQAQHVLFPTANNFVSMPIVLNKSQLDSIKKLSGVPQRTATPAIWRVEQNGRAQGWLLIDQVIGKHEYITYATAISPDGHVMGVEILRYLESYGGEVVNPRWRDKFRGKALSDKFRLNDDIPNISGATLSSRNLTDGVKRMLALYSVALAHG